jgi:hypothetical protein
MNKPLFGGKKESQFADTEPASTMPMELATDDQYANTVPQPLAAAPAPKQMIPDLGLSLAPVQAGENELMAETRKDGRVCPMPTRWLEFYRVLQDNARGAALPQPPLSGSSWAGTPPSAKRQVFVEHLEWAVKNGCVGPAFHFLEALPKNDWYYGN